MQTLELLSPARNLEIGIAAINCGADAVYIAGPQFGARKAAGNSYEEIEELCTYAHRFGARVFVTFNTIIEDSELEDAHAQAILAQKAGADALIIRDPRICLWEDITIPLHASTQCAIRSTQRAQEYENLGCARLILERELSLTQIREIAQSTQCEIEFFVHGALCVCYSGDCRLSEFIDGRSADKGECIQACRSLYDLRDESGKLLIHNKALLSLKDYNLSNRIEELAEAGVCSFKIEGRLKNASYVKNVTRAYDILLNDLVAKFPNKYRRASHGKVKASFIPDVNKTFNRGYTELFLDGNKSKWSSMDAPKSMGEAVGIVSGIKRNRAEGTMELSFKAKPGITIQNGDGLCFSNKDGVTGFRVDICKGPYILAKDIIGLREKTTLYRNISTEFEKTLNRDNCVRVLSFNLTIKTLNLNSVIIQGESCDGRTVQKEWLFDTAIKANNPQRMLNMLREQMSKKSGIYECVLNDIQADFDNIPLLSAATINGFRRELTEELDKLECIRIPMSQGKTVERQATLPVDSRTYNFPELMRSKYCVRYELGLCPKQGAKGGTRPLFLENNGRRFKLSFDCAACEMTLSSD